MSICIQYEALQAVRVSDSPASDASVENSHRPSNYHLLRKCLYHTPKEMALHCPLGSHVQKIHRD